ncbi:hypothetical protein ACIBEA_43755 [Streptomyces sp. NPDC051555]|uniref:hypothetical protein n=1 Tax=Streptomyces sp. NPDC051555 TaxID=3365657 RepID=UPI00379C1C16
MTLWRQVLAALNDHSLDTAERDAILARGAAHLAARRTPEGKRTTHEEVMAVAFEEFGILLDTHQARTALRSLDSGRTRG